MDNKKKESFLLALNVLFGEVGLPTKLYVDEEKGLLALHRDMIIEVNEVILKEHEVAIEQVTARQHSAHSLVERRMAVFGQHMGTLDVKKANMTKIEASNYIRVIASRLNEKPYGIRFLDRADTGPLDPAQDLPMEVIAPNHWKISHRTNSPDAAFIHLPGTLKDHQLEVASQLKMLAEFYDTKMLPNLLLDVDRKRTITDTPLRVNSVVLFWPEGNDGTRPKGSQPKFARVISLETDADGKQRKAKISYTNANQLKTNTEGQLLGGPIHESYRSVDQLIPVDDASQTRSVQAMLEKASQIATKPNKSHLSPAEFQLNEDQITNNIENENTGTALHPPTPLASVENDENQTKPDNEEEDMITSIEGDEKEIRTDPTYTSTTTVIAHDKRVTRSTKDPSTPHCALISRQ